MTKSIYMWLVTVPHRSVGVIGVPIHGYDTDEGILSGSHRTTYRRGEYRERPCHLSHSLRHRRALHPDNLSRLTT